MKEGAEEDVEGWRIRGNFRLIRRGWKHKVVKECCRDCSLLSLINATKKSWWFDFIASIRQEAIENNFALPFWTVLISTDCRFYWSLSYFLSICPVRGAFSALMNWTESIELDDLVMKKITLEDRSDSIFPAPNCIDALLCCSSFWMRKSPASRREIECSKILSRNQFLSLLGLFWAAQCLAPLSVQRLPSSCLTRNTQFYPPQVKLPVSVVSEVVIW